MTNSGDRKKDHLDLAKASQVNFNLKDDRFDYDPINGIHPTTEDEIHIHLAGADMKFPLWISSMTGGTEHSRIINQRLAEVCAEFGLGMGLGSCRKILTNSETFDDFNVRKYIGNQPLYANLGIVQVHESIKNGSWHLVEDMVSKLEANGLIIHVNPLQEWMQKEGDRMSETALETILKAIEFSKFPLIVKEVGQGMSKSALLSLLSLPLAAIEFGAFGGTNFSKLESLRSNDENYFEPICFVGHDAEEMTQSCNQIFVEYPEISGKNLRLIISGGVQNFLDGYYLTSLSKIPAMYGQAAPFLNAATESYQKLREYTKAQINGFLLAKQFLKLKKSANG